MHVHACVASEHPDINDISFLRCIHNIPIFGSCLELGVTIRWEVAVLEVLVCVVEYQAKGVFLATPWTMVLSPHRIWVSVVGGLTPRHALTLFSKSVLPHFQPQYFLIRILLP